MLTPEPVSTAISILLLVLIADDLMSNWIPHKSFRGRK